MADRNLLLDRAVQLYVAAGLLLAKRTDFPFKVFI